ncbi:hypothetical protein FACS1894190_13620 [Spirochaetia bacterium]|nr:hypothetical protein FACS1894190_13620 [Spirochaetia bacterium]
MSLLKTNRKQNLTNLTSGYILLDKPSGITSFDALQPFKKALMTGKIGHTGTLDKFACGLLIILTGHALKLTNFFLHCDKRYEGVIRFGEETDTLDPEGAVVYQCDVPTENAVRAVLPQFTGAIMQEPPVFSALHIDGKRASDLVRSGANVEMKARPVTIHSLELMSWEPPFAKITVHCSSGTYIRSLARDIGRAALSCGSLSSLRRTSVGGVSLEEGALTISPDKRERLDPSVAHDAIKPVDKNVLAKIGLNSIDVPPAVAASMRYGKPLSQISGLPFSAAGLQDSVHAIFCQDELVAVIEKAENKMRYVFVNGAGSKIEIN